MKIVRLSFSHHRISSSPPRLRWMNTLLRENRLEDVVDKRCKDADIETVEAVLEIAARCTDAIRDDQPSMNQVPHLLEQRGHVTFA